MIGGVGYNEDRDGGVVVSESGFSCKRWGTIHTELYHNSFPCN